MDGFHSVLTSSQSVQRVQVYLRGFPGSIPLRGGRSYMLQDGSQLRRCRLSCQRSAALHMDLQWMDLELSGYLRWKINLLPKSVLGCFLVLFACLILESG